MIYIFTEHLLEHLKLTREARISEKKNSRLTPSKLIIYALESQRRDCKLDPKESHDDPAWVTLKIEYRSGVSEKSCLSVKTQIVHNLI